MRNVYRSKHDYPSVISRKTGIDNLKKLIIEAIGLNDLVKMLLPQDDDT